MNSSEKIMVALGILILAGGIFLALKGKSSMIRERFGSGVSPENERKFMATIVGAVCVIGLDMLALVGMSVKFQISQEVTLVILGVGIALFVGIILIGQKYYRR